MPAALLMLIAAVNFFPNVLGPLLSIEFRDSPGNLPSSRELSESGSSRIVLCFFFAVAAFQASLIVDERPGFLVSCVAAGRPSRGADVSGVCHAASSRGRDTCGVALVVSANLVYRLVRPAAIAACLFASLGRFAKVLRWAFKKCEVFSMTGRWDSAAAPPV